MDEKNATPIGRSRESLEASRQWKEVNPLPLCNRLLGPGSNGARCTLRKGHPGDMHTDAPGLVEYSGTDAPDDAVGDAIEAHVRYLLDE